MSTWINRLRRLSLILLLAACQMDASAFAPTGQARAISVLAGTMQVAAPSGYCVDKQSARQQDDGAVVLMGRCGSGSTLAPAVISVTVGATGSAGVLADGGTALAAYFQTEAGRAALSSSGSASAVQIVQAGNSDGAFTMRIVENQVGDYWRAIVGISGRLVTLSVQGPADKPLDPAIGRRLLSASISAMRRANPAI